MKKKTKIIRELEREEIKCAKNEKRNEEIQFLN